jgi:hypothetical protein
MGKGMVISKYTTHVQSCEQTHALSRRILCIVRLTLSVFKWMASFSCSENEAERSV